MGNLGSKHSSYSTCFFSTFITELFGHCIHKASNNAVWISDIAAFNLAEGKPSAKIAVLKPGNFPSTLRARIKLITYTWGSPKQICERLNIPLEFVISGAEYKYTYEYYKKFSTLALGKDLEDFEFSRRLDDSEHSDFMSMF
jgi:hypothetical protein